MFKKLAVIAALSVGSSAFAAEYYIVVPFNKKSAPTSPAPAVSVSLNSYSLPAATVGLTYSGFNLNDLLVVTGDASYVPGSATWSVVSGALPAGITLSANGALSGTPTSAGTSTFQLKASYKTKEGTQTYQIVVADLSVALADGAIPSGMLGSAYSYDFNQLLSVTGDPNYSASKLSWQLTGTLPNGLSFNSSNGTLSGTPTVPGISSLLVRASYASKYAEKSYNLSVGADFGLFNAGEGVNADRISAATPKYGRVTVGAKPISSGKHYVELYARGYRHQFGITTKATNDTLSLSSVYPLENKTDAVAAYLTSVSSNVFAYINASAATKISGPLSTCSDSNCMVGLAIDADNNTVTWIGPSGTIGSYTVLMPKPWYVTVARGNSNTGGELSVELNTGQKAFTYAVPNGFRPGLY